MMLSLSFYKSIVEGLVKRYFKKCRIHSMASTSFPFTGKIRHLGIYYPHMPIGKVWIYRVLCVCVCFFVCFLVLLSNGAPRGAWTSYEESVAKMERPGIEVVSNPSERPRDERTTPILLHHYEKIGPLGGSASSPSFAALCANRGS